MNFPDICIVMGFVTQPFSYHDAAISLSQESIIKQISTCSPTPAKTNAVWSHSPAVPSTFINVLLVVLLDTEWLRGDGPDIKAHMYWGQHPRIAQFNSKPQTITSQTWPTETGQYDLQDGRIYCRAVVSDCFSSTERIKPSIQRLLQRLTRQLLTFFSTSALNLKLTFSPVFRHICYLLHKNPDFF